MYIIHARKIVQDIQINLNIIKTVFFQAGTETAEEALERELNELENNKLQPCEIINIIWKA